MFRNWHIQEFFNGWKVPIPKNIPMQHGAQPPKSSSCPILIQRHPALVHSVNSTGYFNLLLQQSALNSNIHNTKSLSPIPAYTNYVELSTLTTPSIIICAGKMLSTNYESDTNVHANALKYDGATKDCSVGKVYRTNVQRTYDWRSVVPNNDAMFAVITGDPIQYQGKHWVNKIQPCLLSVGVN